MRQYKIVQLLSLVNYRGPSCKQTFEQQVNPHPGWLEGYFMLVSYRRRVLERSIWCISTLVRVSAHINMESIITLKLLTDSCTQVEILKITNFTLEIYLTVNMDMATTSIV